MAISWVLRMRPARALVFPARGTTEDLAKSEVSERVLHIGDQPPPAAHVRIRQVFERERHPPLPRAGTRDPMAQRVSIEEDEPSWGQPNRSRYDGRALLPRMQLVFEAAGRFVDHAEEQSVAPPLVVRGVVMPADVISGTRVEVQRVRVRVIVGRRPQALACNLLQPLQQSARTVQLGDEGRPLIDRMPANAAALFVTRQIV